MPTEKIRETVVLATITVLAVMVLAACSGGSKELSKTDIQLAAGALRTYASSTRMLLEQCSAGRATETFCRKQRELLSSKVDGTLHDLDRQGGDAEAERKQLADIGTALSDIILKAERSPSTDREVEDAGRLAAISKTLENQLRK